MCIRDRPCSVWIVRVTVMMNGFEYAGVDAILAGSFRAAIYCRLSKDDDLDGESASIANQRDMLENYCEKQGWEVVAVYQDDGYTGLNMERPDLKRMLKAIERRQINLVVTKEDVYKRQDRGRVANNDLCRKCQHECKQSFRAVVIDCPHYLSKRAKRKEKND